MKGKLKKTGYSLSVLLITLALVTAMPVMYSMIPAPVTPEPDHNGEAEAIAPIVAGGVLAGYTAGALASYQARDYFDDANDQVNEDLQEDVNKSIDEATNDTLRSAVHSNAIVSEGSNIGFLDNVDNDATTLEGQVDQRVAQRILRVADSVGSEQELKNEAEAEASEYLQVRQSNLLETHNFMGLSTKQYYNQLNTAGYGGDIGAVNIAKVGSKSELKNNCGAKIIRLTDNIDLGDSYNDCNGNGAFLYPSSDSLILELNGYSITDNSSATGTNNFIATTGNIFIKGDGGAINLTGVSYDFGAGIDVRSSGVVGISVTNTDVSIPNVPNIVSDNNGNSNPQVYNTSSVSSWSVASGVTFVDKNPVNDPVGSLNSITFNKTEIANANSNYASASDVPVATFTNNNETVSLPAVEVTLDSSYMGSNNTVKFATPYDASTGKPLVGNSNTANTLIIKTTTSGVSSYAEPVDYARAYDMLTTADDLSSTIYNSVSNYASAQWNKYIQEVALNESKSISDNEKITKDLGQLTTPVPSDAGDTEQVVTQYVGIYEGTTLPASDVLYIKDDGETYKGALFSTDMSALMSQTSNADKVEVGDTFDVSQTNRTFIVDQDTGESYDLDGSVEVTDIEGKDTADVREYDLERTDLGGQAQRLTDQAETTERVVDNPDDYVPPTIQSGGSGLPLETVLVALAGVLVLVLVMRDD